ncbi:hypothetical protein Tco_0437869, partial [Tanacetum coccineum]
HSSVNDFVIINIPEEDVETKQIILDPDDQPMWESATTVAPTPNFAIVQPNVDDNFVINSTHLKMILENKFDGYLRADLHEDIREFLAICGMFKYELNNDVRNDLEDFKSCIRSLRTAHDKLFDRDDQSKTDLMVKEFQIYEWSKSQNVSLEPTDRTDPPPPLAQTEQVNVVFIGIGKSDDSLKIQEDPPPPIVRRRKEREKDEKLLSYDDYGLGKHWKNDEDYCSKQQRKGLCEGLGFGHGLKVLVMRRNVGATRLGLPAARLATSEAPAARLAGG